MKKNDPKKFVSDIAISSLNTYCRSALTAQNFKDCTSVQEQVEKVSKTIALFQREIDNAENLKSKWPEMFPDDKNLPIFSEHKNYLLYELNKHYGDMVWSLNQMQHLERFLNGVEESAMYFR